MNVERLENAYTDDLSRISELLNQLRSNNTVPDQTGLARMIADANTEIWVARDERRMVGMATLLFIQKLPRLIAYVDDVVVDESARGHGLGKAIMEKVIDRARERGADAIELTSRPSRTAANAMYPKLGFKIRETNVYRLDL